MRDLVPGDRVKITGPLHCENGGGQMIIGSISKNNWRTDEKRNPYR